LGDFEIVARCYFFSGFIEVVNARVDVFNRDSMDYDPVSRLSQDQSFICCLPVDMPEAVCFLLGLTGEANVVALQDSKSSNLEGWAGGFVHCFLEGCCNFHIVTGV